MSCQGDDSTEETPPGAGHLGASHANFKSSVSCVCVGEMGRKTGVNFTLPALGWVGVCSINHVLQLHAAGSLNVCSMVRGWGQSNTLAVNLL